MAGKSLCNLLLWSFLLQEKAVIAYDWVVNFLTRKKNDRNWSMKTRFSHNLYLYFEHNVLGMINDSRLQNKTQQNYCIINFVRKGFPWVLFWFFMQTHFVFMYMCIHSIQDQPATSWQEGTQLQWVVSLASDLWYLMMNLLFSPLHWRLRSSITWFFLERGLCTLFLRLSLLIFCFFTFVNTYVYTVLILKIGCDFQLHRFLEMEMFYS